MTNPRHPAIVQQPSAPPRVRVPKVSQRSVWDACERRVTAGQRPSVRGVRLLLGGGSLRDIHKHIQTWRVRFVQRTSAAPETMPVGERALRALRTEVRAGIAAQAVLQRGFELEMARLRRQLTRQTGELRRLVKTATATHTVKRPRRPARPLKRRSGPRGQRVRGKARK
jgi:hypothetical protein